MPLRSFRFTQNRVRQSRQNEGWFIQSRKQEPEAPPPQIKMEKKEKTEPKSKWISVSFCMIINLARKPSPRLGTVVSLFDGISCGQVALRRAGISYERYYASEITPSAIAVTQKNFPKTIQMGDVCGLSKGDFGEERVDLLMGGSPCQGFSKANTIAKAKGRKINFEDPRSKLFFEYL